jgi:hypothetical protein
MAVRFVLSVATFLHDAPQLHHSDNKISITGFYGCAANAVFLRQMHGKTHLLSERVRDGTS